MVGIVAMIGTLVAVSVSGSLNEQRLRSTLDDLAVEVRSAQSEAALTGEERILRYDLDNQRLTLETVPELNISDLAGEDDAEDMDRRRRELRSKHGEETRSYDIPHHVRLSAIRIGKETIERGEVPVMFGPDGVSEAHRIRLTPESEEKTEIALEVRGLTGEMTKLDLSKFDKDWDESPPGHDPALLEEEDFFDQDFGPVKAMPSSGSSGQKP